MKLTVNGKEYEVEFAGADGDARVVKVNDNYYAVTVMGDRPLAAGPASPAATPTPTAAPNTPAAAPASAPAIQTVAAAAGETVIAAPMPGTVLSVGVAPGDTISKGDPLMVLESMKMENNLPAPADGTIKQVLKSAGDQVARGDALIVIGD